MSDITVARFYDNIIQLYGLVYVHKRCTIVVNALLGDNGMYIFP